jgi:hypothetical protein
MGPLEDAIDFYCNELSNLNEDSNRHDDTRLYTIAYFSYKCNVSVSVETLVKHLKLNKKISKYSDEDIRLFAEKKIQKIEHAKYIFSRIPGWI